jgi:hypothetical protein
LIIAFAAGEGASALHDAPRFYARSIGYLGMTVRAYEERRRPPAHCL